MSCVRDMTKTVFLEDEYGMDMPSGDIPNLLKFPKVFSLFRATSLFLVIKMPRVPRLPREHLLFHLSSRESPLLGSHSRSFPPGAPELYPVCYFILIPIPF